MSDIITHNGVRVFRPEEYKLLTNHIDKQEMSIFLNTALFTGMRYIELQRLQDNSDWFDKKRGFIHLPETAQLKKKRKQRERWVRLNPLGRTYVDFFLNTEKKLPTRQSWDENLKRWAKKASLDPRGCCAKSTRKTWESWLCYFYPSQLSSIVLSQGHDTLTSIHHYQMLPFSESEKPLIAEYVSGWI